MESASSAFDREPGGVPLPPPPSRERDGLSALERKALFRVHTELPAMPASLVVQILLWPEKITDWARDETAKHCDGRLHGEPHESCCEADVS